MLDKKGKSWSNVNDAQKHYKAVGYDVSCSEWSMCPLGKMTLYSHCYTTSIATVMSCELKEVIVACG